MHKRYVVVALVLIIVGILIWKLSGTYAIYNQGYTGNKIVDGTNWALNIVSVSDALETSNAMLTKEVSTIGTTLNFEVSLPEVTSSLTFDVEIQNMGNLEAELYAFPLTGLSSYDSEYINYEIIPLDYVTVKTEGKEGSSLKKGEKHTFRVKVNYQDNINENNTIETLDF